MLPILFSIGPFKLYTLVLVSVISFFAGLFVVWKRGKELHYEEKELFDLTFFVLFWLFIGSRIGYILTHPTYFWGNFDRLFNIVGSPGWYFPAGLLCAFIALKYRAKKYKWEFFQLMDLFSTGLVLTQAIMSLGTFLAGVGYGLPTTLFFGIPVAGLYDRRIPVQLFELVAYLCTFCYLWWAEGVYRTFGWYRRNRSQAMTGYLVAMYLCLSSIVQVIAALLKTPELSWGMVRFDIGVPLLGFCVGIFMLLQRAGVTFAELRERVLSYFGIGKSHTEKVKERLDTIRDLLDE